MIGRTQRHLDHRLGSDGRQVPGRWEENRSLKRREMDDVRLRESDNLIIAVRANGEDVELASVVVGRRRSVIIRCQEKARGKETKGMKGYNP